MTLTNTRKCDERVVQRLQDSPISVVGLDEESIARTAEAEPHTYGGGGIIAVNVDVESLETENSLWDGAVYVSVGFVVPLWIGLEAGNVSSRPPSIHWIDKAHVLPVDIGRWHVHFIACLWRLALV